MISISSESESKRKDKDATNHIIDEEMRTIGYPVHENVHRVPRLGDVMSQKLEELYGDSEVLILCRGSSGSILGSYVAIKNGYHLFHVKKDGEKAHRAGNVFYVERLIRDKAGLKIIIIDDFMSSGETIKSIHRAVSHLLLKYEMVIDSVCVGGGVSYSRLNIPINNIICQYIVG